jgi:hypothetical protein
MENSATACLQSSESWPDSLINTKPKNKIVQDCHIEEETMLSRCFMIITIITSTLVMFSCSGTTPAHKQSLLERNWGRSFETASYLQVVNPDAEKNLDPISGLDGTASQHNVDKYKTSFQKPEPKEIVNILKLQ